MESTQHQTVPSRVEENFQECLRKFKTRLSKKERDQFEVTTLQELRVSLLQIQKKQATNSQSMNLPRIVRFLDAFKQFGQIVEVFLNTSEFVAFIWGPMKFLLQVCLRARYQDGCQFHAPLSHFSRCISRLCITQLGS